jgi:hypothetical protein
VQPTIKKGIAKKLKISTTTMRMNVSQTQIGLPRKSAAKQGDQANHWRA